VGIFNTFFWIDREKQIAAVFMTQMLPFMDPRAATAIGEFDPAVYAWKRPGRIASARVTDAAEQPKSISP
jgi:methyl acetate hydrolase